MSFFTHSSTPQKLSDNVARFRYTEVPVEGGSSSLTQGNQIKFRFSSNQDSWHAPSLSYILYEIETLQNGAPIESAHNVVFNSNIGASLSNGGPSSINLNGVDVAVAQSPAVTSEMYNRMFMEKSVRSTIGEAFLDGRASGNLLQVAYQIPCGLVLGNDKAIPGGQWVYSVNLSNNFIRDCITSDGSSVGRSLPNLSITIKNARFVCCHVSPADQTSVPRNIAITCPSIHTQSTTVSADAIHTLAFTVPPSSRKLLFATQIANLTHLTASSCVGLDSGARFQSLQAEYSGQSQPTVAFDQTGPSIINQYLQLYNEKMSSGRSGMTTLSEFEAEPILACHFARSSESISTNVLLRAQLNASSGPGGASTVFCSALHDQSIIISYNGSGIIEQVVNSVLSA